MPPFITLDEGLRRRNKLTELLEKKCKIVDTIKNLLKESLKPLPQSIGNVNLEDRKTLTNDPVYKKLNNLRDTLASYSENIRLDLGSETKYFPLYGKVNRTRELINSDLRNIELRTMKEGVYEALLKEPIEVTAMRYSMEVS